MKSKHLLLMLLLAFMAPWAANAQGLSNYVFSTGTDATQWITLSSNATQIVASAQDDGASSLTNIGFTFPFGDGTYTQFWANSNGIFSFNSTTNGSAYNNQFNSSNYTANQPKICGISRDMSTGAAGYVKYELTGTTPNRVLVCEFKLNTGYSTSGTNYIMWQVQLHESNGKVNIVYGTAVANPSQYQIGLSSSSSDIWTINPSTHVATHATGAVSTTYSVWPGENRYYSFMVPTDPYITLSPGSTTVVTGFTQTLTASYGNVSGTPTIAYSSSDDRIASVSGSGTTATVTGVSAGTATITATMNYGGNDYTATCAVTVEDPSLCEPYFSTPSDDYISNFATTGGETNINNSSTYDDGGYSNYYDTKSASITAGETLSCTITPSSTSWSYGNAIWVDWNGDWVFADDERVAYSAVVSGEWNGEFVVPATTPAGDYHMRVMHIYNATATNPCISASYGEAEDYKLTVNAASPYQRPVNLAARNVTNNSATLAWEAPNTDVQSYKYQYRPQGGTWNELTSTTALSAPLTGLTGNTTYEFQVQAIYAGNNESTFASTTFTTECDAYSIAPTAYTYGFEDAADMACWELVNGVTNTGIWDNATMDYNFGYEPARTGDNVFMFIYVDYDDTDPQYQTLISPELTDVPETGVHVEFYYVGDMDGSGQETFRVGYSLTNNDLTSFVWDAEVTNVSDAYQRFSANYPAGTKYVAIQHTSDDQYYLFLDDITFEGAASCLEPTGVTASNITTTGADISWTPGGSEGEWALYVTTTATDVPDDTTTPTVASTDENPHTLTGLTPATTYYVYVRGNCRENSAWSTPAIFHTECEGMDLPYGPYSFEDGALSVCWNVINTNTSYNSLTVSESNANTGTHSLSFFRGSTTGDLVAVLPVVGAYNLSDYQFELSAMGAYEGYEITVGIMTDPEDLTTFVAQGDVITTTNSYAEHKVRFNEYTGTGKYVAIKVVRPSTVTYGNTYIDDIAINLIPSCIEPDGLAVSNETAHGATFAWTAGAATQTTWQLYISTSNVAPADDIDEREVIAADSNPFTVTTGLDPENDYYVWVRANCGGTDGYSAWVGPVSFTTGIACPAPTGLAADNITSHTADLSWTGTSESYKVMFRTAAYLSSPILNEEFNTTTLPTGWGRSSTALTDNVLNGTTTINSTSSGWVNSSYGLGAYNWKMNIYSTYKYWLITPSTAIGTNYMLSFDAALTAYNSNNAPSASNMANTNSRFVVLITTDDQATWTILREWNNTGSADVLNNISNTGNNFSIDLSSYAGETVKIAFYGGQTASGPDCDLHIDNVMIGEAVTAGAWVNRTTDELFYQLTNLAAETKYEAKVQGNCGTEGMSQETASIFFTTDIACPAPTGLTASNPTSTSIELTWTNGGAANWILALKKDGDADFTEMNLSELNVTVTGNVITYTLGSLLAETGYTVKVRDNCEASVAGDGVSEWTTEVSFSTIAACSALNPVVSNITHYTATVNWEGESASGFTVKYREAAHIDGISEEFSGTSIPTNWTMYTGLVDNVIAGSATLTSTSYGWTMTTASPNVFNSNHIRLNIYGSSRYHWLVTPEINLPANSGLSFDLALTAYASNGNSTSAASGTCDDERFVVLIFANNAWEILREWNNDGTGDAVYNDIATAGENVNIDLSSYSGTVKIAFYGESTTSGNGDNDMHLDNVTIGVNVPAATTWQTQPATATTANLTGLTAGTLYDVKVVPNCDETQESATVQFTTIADNVKYFLTAGDWATATNWLDGEMPTITDNAIIRANAIINAGTVATANTISFEGSPTPTLTIENGAQLKHNNTNTINATVKKNVTGYEAANVNTNNGYVLFAPPFGKSIYTNNSDGTGLRNGIYDLYSWSPTSNLEWIYYGSNNTSSLYMSRGTGYLYANQETTEVTFTGGIYGSGSSYQKSVTYTAPTTGTTDFADWNLIGNPFVCDAYLVNASTGGTALAYYRMNGDGNGFVTVANGAAIAPMEGIFYQATSSGSVYMTRTAPAVTSTGNGQLNINLAQNVTTRGAKGTTDNAIIRFGEGNTLEKFSFREGSSKVYISQEGKDYAVVNAEAQGEIPVSFKAEKNGSYSLSFTAEEVSFSYLHLIDNLTGVDVDLLETPAYTFDARTSDYASRFKLVFATGNVTEDNFAYFNNGSLVINNDGNATVQVVDVMGRILSSETINGSANINVSAAAGVYVIRLINGENVKTQKIVVR